MSGIDLGPYMFWFILGGILIIVGLILSYTVSLSAGDFVSFGIPFGITAIGALAVGIGIAMFIQQMPPCISSSGLC